MSSTKIKKYSLSPLYYRLFARIKFSSLLSLSNDLNAKDNKTTSPERCVHKADGYLPVLIFTIVEVTQLQLHPAIGPLTREPWVTKNCTTCYGNATTPHLPWIDTHEIMAIKENAALQCESSRADSDRRLLEWTKAAPVFYPQHNVSGIHCVFGQHVAINLAMYFQRTATPELGSIWEYSVTNQQRLNFCQEYKPCTYLKM